MVPGHRVERFRFKSAATVKAHAPWAKVVARVGTALFVAYEAEADALEEHGHVGRVVSVDEPVNWKDRIGQAVRRGDGTIAFRCSMCRLTKPDCEFWRNGKSKPRFAYCRDCASQYQRARKQARKSVR